MEWIILAVSGLFSGIVGALVGLGGGVILVPAILFFGATLSLIPNITPQSVVGLSVVMMIFTGLSSTLSYMKTKTVDFKSGFIFFIGSIPGTILGAFVNKGLDLPSFNLYFGILLVILSTLLLVRDRLSPVRWFVENGKKKTFNDGEKTLCIWISNLVCIIINFWCWICIRSIWNWWRIYYRTCNDITIPISASCGSWYVYVYGISIIFSELCHTYFIRKCTVAVYDSSYSCCLYWSEDRSKIK